MLGVSAQDGGDRTADDPECVLRHADRTDAGASATASGQAFLPPCLRVDDLRTNWRLLAARLRVPA